MSKNFTQLGLEQRYQIEALIKAGINQKNVAFQVGVHPSTISRELKRNVPKAGRGLAGYHAQRAQDKTKLRHRYKAKQILFSEQMKQIIVRQLKDLKWSPELISAIGKKSIPGFVSHEWIYKWIWSCKRSQSRELKAYRDLYESLRHGKRRKKRGNTRDRRGVIQNRIPIEQRPKIVQKRNRPGDLEVDLMMGKSRKGAILVMTDRSTLHTRVIKLKNKASKNVKATIVRHLSQSPYKLYTLTFDNDQAFANHEAIARDLKINAYFTRPYTSQDKGTVENRIGVIRRFIPKKTDLRTVTAWQVKQIEKMLNNRPIRKFNYLTANQVLQKKIAFIS